MYTDYLKGLAELAEALDIVAKIGSDGSANGKLPTPYIGGKIEVRLEGEVVGHFIVEDEFVVFEPNADTMSKERMVIV